MPGSAYVQPFSRSDAMHTSLHATVPKKKTNVVTKRNKGGKRFKHTLEDCTQARRESHTQSCATALRSHNIGLSTIVLQQYHEISTSGSIVNLQHAPGSINPFSIHPMHEIALHGLWLTTAIAAGISEFLDAC